MAPSMFSAPSSSSSLEDTPNHIGTILSKEGQITAVQLQNAMAIHQRTGKSLASVLLAKGYIEEDTIVNVLTRTAQYQTSTLNDATPEDSALALLSPDTARAYMVCPLSVTNDSLVLAMEDPTDTKTIAMITKRTGKSIQPVAARQTDILRAIQNLYTHTDSSQKTQVPVQGNRSRTGNHHPESPVLNDFGSLVSQAVTMFRQNPASQDMEKDDLMASGAPMVQLVNGIMAKAVQDKASDIHIEPFEDLLQVRFRLDGSMYKAMNLPLAIKNALISRIKILSKLDIAERRIPQDGRFTFQTAQNKPIDFRVSVLPTLFGESVVMRLLDPDSLNIDLSCLGIAPDTLEQLSACIQKPYGLVLVTGPTGSGKTTTLYSILNQLNSEEVKILTVEDPVEFHFRGINQVQVKDDVGMDFATALRAFLRQDPDIIMVGEIRDTETAQIAVTAAMTGHLVFATLHTNDCASTIIRLKNMGIPSYLLASTVSMVLSQRLVRTLCPHCKQAVLDICARELERHGFRTKEMETLSIMESKGCTQCHGTGYKGRTGLYELMMVTDEISEAIAAEVPEYQLRNMALAQGMVSLRMAGLAKAATGETSLDEVLKHTVMTRNVQPSHLDNLSKKLTQNDGSK